MTVRLNDYHDLPVIQALYELAGFNPPSGWAWTGDWAGWWLIVEDAARRPLGCVQLLMSRPQAGLESLCVPTALPSRLKAAVIKQLAAAALSVLRQLGGIQSVRFQADTTGLWQRVLEHRGAWRIHAYPTYAIGV